MVTGMTLGSACIAGYEAMMTPPLHDDDSRAAGLARAALYNAFAKAG